ncbi:hypothetical protein [Pleurocapsa sp. PCC 7319]|uniref:hypothetical protein n=1 Tax=Pleurocapsa sp. PCC 7319 TaxID=118161 RepID=UPI00034D76EA|nr:hypothetical protein [Pleurocapsa sp. PCC 7319]
MNSNNINPETNPTEINAAEQKNADNQYQQEASKFINDTSLDKMLEMAEIARMKKLSEPPKWVIPDDI